MRPCRKFPSDLQAPALGLLAVYKDGQPWRWLRGVPVDRE